MDNKQLTTTYNAWLLRAHLAATIIISFLEILVYLLLVLYGRQTLSITDNYLLFNTLLPIAVNFAVNFACRTIGKGNPKAAIFATLITAIAISVIHRDFSLALAAPIFPIILSAALGERKTLSCCFIISIVFTGLSLALLYFEQEPSLSFGINAIVLFGFVVVSYLSGMFLISVAKNNFTLISKQIEDNKILEQKLDLDPMTKLYNHETFYEKLEYVIEQADKNGHSCCLAMIDIDKFKSINDKHKHYSGDKVLTVLAGILKECGSGNDYACRYGGEEFGVIFYGETVFEAEKIIADTLKKFSAYRFDFSGECYTFSCGIATFKKGDTAEEMFKRADQLLYAAKEGGRNRITSEKI